MGNSQIALLFSSPSLSFSLSYATAEDIKYKNNGRVRVS